jgi:hypothetical protein
MSVASRVRVSISIPTWVCRASLTVRSAGVIAQPVRVLVIEGILARVRPSILLVMAWRRANGSGLLSLAVSVIVISRRWSCFLKDVPVMALPALLLLMLEGAGRFWLELAGPELAEPDSIPLTTSAKETDLGPEDWASVLCTLMGANTAPFVLAKSAIERYLVTCSARSRATLCSSGFFASVTKESTVLAKLFQTFLRREASLSIVAKWLLMALETLLLLMGTPPPCSWIRGGGRLFSTVFRRLLA